jgi:hypothetical protein
VAEWLSRGGEDPYLKIRGIIYQTLHLDTAPSGSVPMGKSQPESRCVKHQTTPHNSSPESRQG